MNAILLKICLFPVLMLLSYQQTGSNTIVITKNKKIVVIGKALNCMAGAAVIVANGTPGGTPYYLDDMASWDKKFYGKKIKTSGILVIYKLKKFSDPPAQEIGEERILKNPKWELIK